MSYRLVIFDFDGTLADTFPWFLGVLDQLADRFRFRRVPPEEIDTLRGLGARQIVRRLGIPWWRMPAIARYMRRRAAADAGSITLFPGAAEALRTLGESGVRLALVTSNAEASVRGVLGDPILGLFEFVECGAALTGKARRFRRILRRSRVPPGEVLCIGDEIRDAECARAAGIAFGAALWGYTLPDALRGLRPAHAFERIQDLPDALLPSTPASR